MRILFSVVLIMILNSSIATPARALSPSEVLVIANRRVPESIELARYYMGKRNIPPENLLSLATTDKESCSRDHYNRKIAQPVRAFLLKRRAQTRIRAFVTLYGVPLKVAPPELSSAEQKQLRQFEQLRTSLKQKIKTASSGDSGSSDNLQQQLVLVSKKIKILTKKDYGAAVDSELTLVLKNDYALNFWQPNPFFEGYQHLLLEHSKTEVLMGSRIDGPSLAIAKRMIDDGLIAERDGLQGKAYFDAKGPSINKKNLQRYALYDQSLHLAAEQLRSRNLMPVVVDENPELFQAGDAPDSALYCGWYSLSRYVDAFDWRPGAVGYHIASGECATLRPGPGQGWCKRLLEDGVAATLGPVAEPYLQAFPLPDVFFRRLTSGNETLVEAYFHSQRYLSWQMVLLGDPLYRPFAR